MKKITLLIFALLFSILTTNAQQVSNEWQKAVENLSNKKSDLRKMMVLWSNKLNSHKLAQGDLKIQVKILERKIENVINRKQESDVNLIEKVTSRLPQIFQEISDNVDKVSTGLEPEDYFKKEVRLSEITTDASTYKIIGFCIFKSIDSEHYAAIVALVNKAMNFAAIVKITTLNNKVTDLYEIDFFSRDFEFILNKEHPVESFDSYARNMEHFVVVINNIVGYMQSPTSEHQALSEEVSGIFEPTNDYVARLQNYKESFFEFARNAKENRSQNFVRLLPDKKTVFEWRYSTAYIILLSSELHRDDVLSQSFYSCDRVMGYSENDVKNILAINSIVPDLKKHITAGLTKQYQSKQENSRKADEIFK